MKYKQDRSRRSGHAHSKNIQDYGGRNLTMQERAIHLFVNVAALLPKRGGDYYEQLPPGARMAIDAVKREAALLEGTSEAGTTDNCA